MGVIKLFSSNSSSCYNVETPTSPNPNKFRFEIVKEVVRNNTVLVIARYEDCTSYGGLKLLVYDDYEMYKFMKEIKKELDPHFLDDKFGPIARFVPTAKGKILAAEFFALLNEKKE